MTAIKTLAVSVLAWGMLGALAEAAPMSWFGGPSGTSSWYANQSLANGGFYAPPSTPAASSPPSNWFTDPSYLASLNSPAPSPQAASTPTPVPASQPAPHSDGPATAFINLGNGPYAEAGNLTTGGAQAWYNSPAAVQAFGGVPNASQQTSFTQSVLADVQRTFQNSGLNVSLTSDPSAPAQHMISVVSGTSYSGNPGAIGITDVGSNGFSFIDKLAYANSPDQLAWAVAHNVSHELMHAMGVAVHADTTGTYLDSGTATWQMLTDANTKFSPAAVQLMQSAMSGAGNLASNAAGAQTLGGSEIDGDQMLAQPVPEPSTMAVWGLAAAGGLAFSRRGPRRRSR